MPATTTPAEQAVTHIEFFRLPKPGNGDQIFGFSRSYYYEGEKRGWWKLIRIRDKGKYRGVTLIPYEKVAAFVRAQEEAQNR
jgi:hypothetical protein